MKTTPDELRHAADFIACLQIKREVDLPRKRATVDALRTLAIRCEGLMASIELAKAELPTSAVAILDRALGSSLTTHRESLVSLAQVEEAVRTELDATGEMMETAMHDVVKAIVDRLKGGS